MAVSSKNVTTRKTVHAENTSDFERLLYFGGSFSYDRFLPIKELCMEYGCFL